MLKQVLLNNIDPDPNQPRQKFSPGDLAELESSIKEKGILTPLYLESDYNKDSTDRFLILDGERRYRTARKLNLTDVPATVVKGPLSFQERTVLRFHIQEQHKNWSPFDKAKAIYNLKQSTGWSISEIADKLKTSAPRIHNWISITDLTEETKNEIILKNISFAYLIHLIKVTKDYMSFSELSQLEIEEKLVQKIKKKVF